MVSQYVLFLGVVALGMAVAQSRLWDGSETHRSQSANKDNLWESVDNNNKCLRQDIPVKGYEGVEELVRTYYHEFDNLRLKDHVPLLFTREASMHLVMPVIPDRYFFGGSVGEAHNDDLGKWDELHFKGIHEIEKSTKEYLSRLPKHATRYQIRLMEPAVGGAIYVLVSGLMKVEGQRLERFAQTFLFVRDRGSHFKHKIRFTTITSGITHRCAPKPDVGLEA